MRKIFNQIGAFVMAMTVFMSVLPQNCAFAAKKLSVAEWTIDKNGTSTVSIDTEGSKGGRALKISTSGSVVASTKVDVKKGENYILDLYNKANNVSSASVSINGKGYSLKPIQSSFDWTHHKFNYTHEGDDGEITISFTVSGKTDEYWLDCLKFKSPTGENIFKNPQFEERVIKKKATATEGETLEEQYYNLLDSDSFTVESLAKVQAALSTFPVRKAKNITIDGNGDDWADYPEIPMPVLSSQYFIMMAGDPEIAKNNAKAKMAYDDDRFYFYIEVYDEDHVYKDDANYWQADSIQFTLSRLTDTYGYEFGVTYNEDADKASLYTTAVTETEMHALDVAASRAGNITKYEVSTPWSIYYGATKPDDMLFDLLVNENGGNGRCASYEFAPFGISRDKSNVDFPYMMFLDEDNSSVSWIAGERKPTVGEENEYNLYIVNYGEEATFTVGLPDGTEDNVVVGANEGVNYPVIHTFDESGATTLKVTINGEEKSMDVIVLPSIETVDKYTKIFNDNLVKIDKLIKQCDKKKISHDNESAYRFIIERFITYMHDDVNKDNFTKVDYTIEKLSELCDKAINNLNDYLSGKKTPVTAPRYVVTGEDEIDGQDIIGTVEINGEQIKQPVSFIGFGHFDTVTIDSPNFYALGYNTQQREIGPDTILRPRGSDVPGWGFERNNASGTVEIAKDAGVEGNAFKFTSTSPHEPNVFCSFFQMMEVEPDTNYELGFTIKAKEAQLMWYTMNNFDDRHFLPEDISDWTECNATFTTGKNQKYALFRLNTDGTTQDCYVDNIYVRKAGTTENLLKNGDADMEDDGKVWAASSHFFGNITGPLDMAEKNNIGMVYLISPHYLTAGIVDKHPEMRGGVYMTSPGYNVNSDIAREYIEDYLRILMPLIKDYKCIQSITLANEPHFAASGMSWYYQPLWEEYLKNRYGTIENLNIAWAENYDSFEGIAMPTTQSYDTRYYDYIKFNDDQFASWYKFMKGIIREYTDIPVNVKIMTTIAEQDHQGVDRRYKTFFGMNAEPFAEYCEISGNDAILYQNWVASGEEGELEKSMVYDYQTSLRNAPVANTEDHIINDQDSTYIDIYADFVETDLWQGLLHGRTISEIWTWERAPDSTSLFNGLFLDRPDCVAAASEVALDSNRYINEISTLRKEKRDVAILYSISSRVHQTEYMNAVYKAYEACEYNGKHPLIVNEEQIDKIMGCDALIIPHAVHCTAYATAKIKEFIENGGKVLVLGDDSLTYTEATNTKNDEAVRSYIVSNADVHACTPDGNWLSQPDDKEMSDIVENFLKTNKLQYVRLIDAETGDTTDNVEWMYAAKDGKIYVNINNYNMYEAKKVKIEIGGKVVEKSFELRTQSEMGEEIELKPYDPKLFVIDSDNMFFDILGHWSEEEVKALADKKIVNGVSATRFAPEKKISRAEFITLVLNSIGADITYSETSFNDVSKDDWFGKAVATASKLGLISEIAEGNHFNPNKPITRAEMMTVLAKAYEYKGKTLSNKEKENFTDIADVDSKLAAYVNKAIGMGWVKGSNGKLMPNNLSTRAEAAALIGRFIGDL